MKRWTFVWMVAALVAAGALVTQGAAQQAPFEGRLQSGPAGVSLASQIVNRARVAVQRVGLPGLDTGMHASDMGRLRTSAVDPAAPIIDRRPSPGGAYVPGRLIVKFTSQVPLATRTAVLAAHAARIGTRPPNADFDVAAIDPSVDPVALAQTLQQRPDVAYAQADYRMHPYMVPNDPLYSYQWNFEKIGMEQAWDINPGATSSIVVAVLDTGVAFENVRFQFQAASFQSNNTTYPALGTLALDFAPAPDLASANRFVSPWDFIWGDADPVDLDGHGTHVSGTLGQLTNNNVGTAGMAYNVRIMPVKVLDGNWDDIFGSPNQGTDSVVAEGIRYAADHGANVINMSLGRTGPPAPVIQDAMQYAVSKGVFIAVAAGNDYENGNPDEVLPEIAAQIQGAVAVGAVDENLNHAPYSSAGSYVELAAPGGSFDNGFGAKGGILQQTLDLSQVDTYDNPVAQFGPPRFDAFAYYFFTGTSMATPHVSALAAMLMQQGIKSPAAIEAAMEQFATDEGTPGRDDEYGFGLINPRATLLGLGLAR
ncbi:MAG: S8 family serine peptidase [Acidobacteriota bacterium]|nr:S8 family serine peptidase [Acidobacteriota bacterium]